MLYRALDNDGDMTFGQNSQNFLSETAAVVQTINTRMKLLEGEWWEDTSDGLPLFQQILGVPGTSDNIKIIDQLIQDRILGTTGVTTIDSFTSTWTAKTRAYDWEAVVTTEYSTTTTVTGSLE